MKDRTIFGAKEIFPNVTDDELRTRQKCYKSTDVFPTPKSIGKIIAKFIEFWLREKHYD